MSGGAQKQAYEQVQRQSERLQERAYGAALPQIEKQQGAIYEMLDQGGQPGYIKNAFEAQRTGLAEGATAQERLALQQGRRATQGAAEGGNIGAAVAPGMRLGSAMADALYGSRISQAMSGIDQTNKSMQSLIGQSVQTGNASMGFAANQLGAIQNMPQYNQTYGNVLGALNLGGSIYGAGNQAGWFTSNPQIPASTNSFTNMFQNTPTVPPG